MTNQSTDKVKRRKKKVEVFEYEQTNCQTQPKKNVQFDSNLNFEIGSSSSDEFEYDLEDKNLDKFLIWQNCIAMVASYMPMEKVI